MHHDHLLGALLMSDPSFCMVMCIHTCSVCRILIQVCACLCVCVWVCVCPICEPLHCVSSTLQIYNHDQPADPRSVSSGKSVSKRLLWGCCCTSTISKHRKRRIPPEQVSSLHGSLCNQCIIVCVTGWMWHVLSSSTVHKCCFPAQCLIWTLDGAVAHRTPNVPDAELSDCVCVKEGCRLFSF